MKSFNTKLLLLVALTFLSMPAFSQLSFYNANDRLVNPAFHSGVAVTVVDWNSDGLDDIVRLSQGHDLWIEIQNGSGQFEQRHIGDFGGGSVWGMVAADIDKNGYKDVLTGGSTCKIMMMDDNGYLDTMKTLPNGSFFMQNATFGDFNNDGWTDLYACNDVAPSRMWLNDGAGNLESSTLIDFDLPNGSDNSGNYGSVWTDFDNDGDLDLYIAKCRQGVNSSSDPRRIDVMFVNDGSNNFSEQAAAHNLADSAQTWTASFGDIDNDGDLDVFRTEENQPVNLYLNDGTGHYTNGTAASGLTLVMTPIQSVLEDFDNDGYLDILTSGDNWYYFHNNGDGTFTELTTMFGSVDMESFAVGDLNHDGFIDVYAGYAGIYTNPSSIDDVVWLNSGNDNHFFNLVLKGTVSNNDAIGARAIVYSDLGTQIREVRSGESYGTANSMALHFGLGSFTSVDSVVIKWPSGISQTLINPAIDQFLTVIESECVSPNAYASFTGTGVICPGENVTLNALPDGMSYVWSTGAAAQSTVVTQPGEYFVYVTESGNNCVGISPAITIETYPDELAPVIITDDNTTICSGNNILLEGPAGLSSYLWSNGETTQNIGVSESGTYTLSYQGVCQTYTSNPITVNVLNPSVPVAANDTVNAPGGSVTLIASGNNILWYDVASGGSPIASGNMFITPTLTATTTYYAASQEYGSQNFEGGMFEHTGTSNYSGSNSVNAKMYFDVYEDVTLVSVKVYTDHPGERNIQLFDTSGVLIDSQVYDVQGDSAVVPLNFALTAGSHYYITTEASYNLLLANWGNASPRLKRNSTNVDYPYDISGKLSIYDSDQGANVYYYFYNWVVADSFACVSNLVPVEVYYDANIGIANVNNVGVSIYPNPASDMLYVKHNGSAAGSRLIIYDVTGRNVAELLLNNENVQPISTANLAAGLYTVKLQTNGNESITKLVIQR